MAKRIKGVQYRRMLMYCKVVATVCYYRKSADWLQDKMKSGLHSAEYGAFEQSKYGIE